MSRAAPIALFAYNRPAYLRACVETLAVNALAADSDLFVFCDAARDIAASDGVAEVRDFARRITGFRSINVIEQEVNLGLSGSVISGVTRVVGEYGRVIVVEDDLLLAPNFLLFMNDALDAYADDDRVAGIHGYMFPVQRQLPATFFLRDPGCWGWATWQRAWTLFEPDGQRLKDELLHRGLQPVFDYGGSYPYFRMLCDQIEGRNNSWAVRWYARVLTLNMLVLYPGVSLVRNSGTDGSGTHGKMSMSFDVELGLARVAVSEIPVEESPAARQAIADFLASTKPSRLHDFKYRVVSWTRGLGART